MTTILIALAVFVAAFVMDLLWVAYWRAVKSKRPHLGALSSAVIGAVSLFGYLESNRHLIVVLFYLCGLYWGTFVGIEFGASVDGGGIWEIFRNVRDHLRVVRRKKI